MHFVLEYTFDEILSWKMTSNPLEIFKLLQFHPECMESFKVFLDQSNCASLELNFLRPLSVGKDFFEGLPPSILLSQNVILSGVEGGVTIPLASQLNSAENDRILVAAKNINEVKTVLFENVFGEFLPADISSRSKIEAYIEKMRLMEVIESNKSEPLLFQYFEQSWRINRENFICESDFEFVSSEGECGLQIQLTDSPRDFEVIDAKSSADGHLKSALVAALPELKKVNVGLKIRVWDKNESYCSTISRVISTRKQQLISDAAVPIKNFLESETVISRSEEIQKKINAAAVQKLDQRKNSINSNVYVKLGGYTRFKTPKNETETVILFSGLIGAGLLPLFSFEILEYSPSEGIDAICSYKINRDDVLKKEVAVEFEYLFSNFFRHGHPSQHVELIICWRVDTMREKLGKTSYPWLLNYSSENSNILVIEIASFDLER